MWSLNVLKISLPDPGDAHKESWRQVICDDVKAHLTGQDQLEPRRAIVHPQRHVVGVLSPQRIESNSVIEDRLDDCVLWDELVTKHYFVHRVIEAAHAELAHLHTDNFVVKVILWRVWQTCKRNPNEDENEVQLCSMSILLGWSFIQHNKMIDQTTVEISGLWHFINILYLVYVSSEILSQDYNSAVVQ